ncbi:MAG: IS200/IS605 family transposase [Bacteroidetes bacterium]|nr:IS200/IS605 family transposase [Bacteroidota bacterium]
MANTFTQLYFHVVFAVKGRANLISHRWKEELYKYITGIVTNKNQKLLAINGMPDHIHLLVGLRPDTTLSDIVRDIKANSSRFINEKKWVAGKFEWQTGFGAFTLGHSQLDAIMNYIRTQEEHHKTRTFRDEYVELLKRYEIDFKPEYIFEGD